MNALSLFYLRKFKRVWKHLVYTCFLMAVGCTEIIQLELSTDPVRLVVDAVLSNESEYQIVRLSKSVPYFSDQPAPPVSFAKVAISDGDHKFLFTESVENPGYYYISPKVFVPEPGVTYTLTIDDVIIGNEGVEPTYSAVTTMPYPVEADSVDLRLNDTWEIWQVLVWFQDPPDEDNYYLFKVRRNDQLMTYRPKDLRVTDDVFFNGSYVNGIWVQSINAGNNRRQLNDGDIITLDLCSITQDFYRFMDALHKEIRPASPLFSGPPANLPGNISNGALGFFTAIATHQVSVVFDSSRHNQ